MKTKLFTTLFFVAALFCIGCSDNDPPQDQLPPITQTGANTFGAVVDGIVFVTKDKTGYSLPGGGTPKGIEVTVGSFLPDYEYFGIDANDYEGTYIYIYIPKKLPEETTYTFQTSPGVRASLETPNYPHVFMITHDDRYVSYENSGFITFSKVDYNAGIYAGTFSLKLKNRNNPTDIIEITNGRFDL